MTVNTNNDTAKGVRDGVYDLLNSQYIAETVVNALEGVKDRSEYGHGYKLAVKVLKKRLNRE